jgi:hypothetical protein
MYDGFYLRQTETRVEILKLSKTVKNKVYKMQHCQNLVFKKNVICFRKLYEFELDYLFVSPPPYRM